MVTKMLSFNKTILRTGPVVCAVDRNYHIIVPVNTETLMSVFVNGKEYFYHSNGVRRTDVPVQKFIVPMSELDAAKEYTICYQKVISRQPYECIKGKMMRKTYAFRPLHQNGQLHIYVISDCHGIYREAVSAGSYFGNDLDLLILNGDISSSSSAVGDVMLNYDIAYAITKGGAPCIITRGNHDLRGKYAERLQDALPTDSGRSYYQIRLGPLWILVLDCGEDKTDSHREYGGTAAYHSMRIEEGRFLDSLFKDSSAGYNDAGVKKKIVVSHIPLMHRNRSTSKGERPFLIEDVLYQSWIDGINRNIQPDLYIAGHLHRNVLWSPDATQNSRGVCCPILVAGVPKHGADRNFTGAAVILKDQSMQIAFTDKNHTISEDTVI